MLPLALTTAACLNWPRVRTELTESMTLFCGFLPLVVYVDSCTTIGPVTPPSAYRAKPKSVRYRFAARLRTGECLLLYMVGSNETIVSEPAGNPIPEEFGSPSKNLSLQSPRNSTASVHLGDSRTSGSHSSISSAVWQSFSQRIREKLRFHTCLTNAALLG